MISLTQNALAQMLDQKVEVHRPILQMLEFNSMPSSNSQPKIRLMLNDGVSTSSFALLHNSLHNLIFDGVLSNFAIIEIKRYFVSSVNRDGKERGVIIIQALDVLKSGDDVKVLLKSNSKISKNFATNVSKTNVSAFIPKTASDFQNAIITQIAGLSPFQNKWLIKVRVTNKTEKRRWNNDKGQGTLFSMDLLDESGEIRCTAFREICEKYYDMVEIGKIYYISNGVLKPANKQFTCLKNDFEVTLTSTSEVVLSEGESNIPTNQFDFQPIKVIEDKKKDDLIDILGVVKSIGELVTFQVKTTGRTLIKRDVDIVDRDNDMVTLTLWGKQAEDFPKEMNPVIAVKGVKIMQFRGNKSLSCSQSSILSIDPDIPQAHSLREWYNSQGKCQVSKFISGSNALEATGCPWLTFREVGKRNLGKTKTDFYMCKATINIVKSDNILYKSCTAEGCKKKIIELPNQMYSCEKCNLEYSNFQYRLLSNICISDWTGHQWALAFNDETEKILKMPANELGFLKDSDVDLFYKKVSEVAFNSFIFKMRVKLENYNDKSKLKTTISEVQLMNYKLYNEHLLSKIKGLAKISG